MDNTLYRKIFRCRTIQRGCRLGLVLLVLLLAACSEKNEEAPLYNQVHPESWNNTQNVNAGPFHGTEVQNEGNLSCTKCHDISGKGKENLPGCYTCHFDPEGSKVPMGSDWTHGLTRHEEFESDQDVCIACHDQARAFGTGPGICHECHGSGETHVLGQPWLDHKSPEFHGDKPQDECANCHNTANDCNACHFGASGSREPVGSGWQHGSSEDHDDYENQAGTCNQCHTLNRSYGNGPVSCHDCHGSGTTHALGQPWLDSARADYHGNQSQQDCATCHDLSLDCNQCHFGATGRKSPPGSSWPHGREDNHNDQKQYNLVCDECHALTQAYRNEPDDPDCHVCHDN